ncbi:MAG TPA: winged helix-turn-helix domain-containing protein [Streptosporangiaceae bacterium]
MTTQDPGTSPPPAAAAAGDPPSVPDLREITDVRTLRALAHPVRISLIEELTLNGPMTATAAAESIGESPTTCSFHLRQLAKYGFVQDAGPGQDRRERRWRVSDPRLTVRIADGADVVVRQQIERLVIGREMQAILDYSQRPDGSNPEWEQKAGFVSMMAVLSPDEAAELREQWIALLTPYLADASGRQLHPGQRLVRYFMAATPQPEPQPEPGDNKDASDD